MYMLDIYEIQERDWDIINEIDLAQAVAKRFNGTVTAKSDPPATDGDPLSSSPANSAA